MEEDIVRTSSNEKQNFKYNWAYFLGQPDVTRWVYLHTIVVMLINNPELNNLDEELTEEEHQKLLKDINSFNKYYRYIEEIKTEIKGDDSDKHELLNELDDLTSILPEIHNSLLKAFYLLTKNCDLKDISIPSHHILSAKENKLRHSDLKNQKASSM